jgi:hypothetical protein
MQRLLPGITPKAGLPPGSAPKESLPPGIVPNNAGGGSGRAGEAEPEVVRRSASAGGQVGTAPDALKTLVAQPPGRLGQARPVLPSRAQGSPPSAIAEGTLSGAAGGDPSAAHGARSGGDPAALPPASAARLFDLSARLAGGDPGALSSTELLEFQALTAGLGNPFNFVYDKLGYAWSRLHSEYATLRAALEEAASQIAGPDTPRTNDILAIQGEVTALLQRVDDEGARLRGQEAAGNRFSNGNDWSRLRAFKAEVLGIRRRLAAAIVAGRARAPQRWDALFRAYDEFREGVDRQIDQIADPAITQTSESARLRGELEAFVAEIRKEVQALQIRRAQVGTDFAEPVDWERLAAMKRQFAEIAARFRDFQAAARRFQAPRTQYAPLQVDLGRPVGPSFGGPPAFQGAQTTGASWDPLFPTRPVGPSFGGPPAFQGAQTTGASWDALFERYSALRDLVADLIQRSTQGTYASSAAADLVRQDLDAALSELDREADALQHQRLRSGSADAPTAEWERLYVFERRGRDLATRFRSNVARSAPAATPAEYARPPPTSPGYAPQPPPDYAALDADRNYLASQGTYGNYPRRYDLLPPAPARAPSYRPPPAYGRPSTRALPPSPFGAAYGPDGRLYASPAAYGYGYGYGRQGEYGPAPAQYEDYGAPASGQYGPQQQYNYPGYANTYTPSPGAYTPSPSAYTPSPAAYAPSPAAPAPYLGFGQPLPRASDPFAWDASARGYAPGYDPGYYGDDYSLAPVDDTGRSANPFASTSTQIGGYAGPALARPPVPVLPAAFPAALPAAPFLARLAGAAEAAGKAAAPAPK